MAAGLSAMEAEFREIDENGSWNAIYQVGARDESRWRRTAFSPDDPDALSLAIYRL